MYRKCSTEVSVQNQRKVTAGLLKLMQETAYEEITVSFLCQCAGITRRIFSAGRINQHGLTVVNGNHFQIRDMFFVHSVKLSLSC